MSALFSAMVSGISIVLLLYMLFARLWKEPLDMRCVDTVAKYLLYAFLIDFTLEMVDLIQRIYEADESFRSLDFMMRTRLFLSQIVLQIFVGTILPIALLGVTQLWKVSEKYRKAIYVASGLATLVGIFSMRWNVVIGGQLFSKSFLGYTTYKLDLISREGLLIAVALMVLPFVILSVLVKVLPPWSQDNLQTNAAAGN